ncbi:MAG TPA: prepilin-type N-terminal cleavage/methylation domain-containing protein [Longimicrobium sp.]|nr:prepilin-type N-terminal cleavage/methylation domain-containing protein [Longimicrobium sp.]
MTHTILRDRRGMTLAELLVALTIASILITATVRFFNDQARMFNTGTSALSVVQNYRFALSTLGRDLRTAGAGVSGTQPYLVYAGADVVAFNADYLSRDPNDLFSVYVEEDAPTGTVQALRLSDRATLPGTTFSYPSAEYPQRGTNGTAETLIFYFTPDATTPRTDDFVLMRQVNRAPAAVVARNLLRTPGRPFLEYLWIEEDAAAGSQVRVVPAARLPLAHTVPLHGDPLDRPDSLGRIDRVRGVRVSLTATNGLSGNREVRRAATRVVRLANAGVSALQSCGEAPVSGGALAAVPVALPGGVVRVNLAWSAAPDESAGERDVLRYVIWRRASGTPDWGDPYLSVSSGLAVYEYRDEQVVPGTRYDYAIASQDCTPSLSPLAATLGVQVPLPLP